MKNNMFITNWVLKTVEDKYADDIALVISHSTLNIDSDAATVSYFVPVTDKGRQFAQTFILEGRGYDIWGIEWERLERFAALEEYNITVLADSKILYARTPEDAARFEMLKHAQLDNLRDPMQARKPALESYAQLRISIRSCYLQKAVVSVSVRAMCWTILLVQFPLPITPTSANLRLNNWMS